MQMYSDTENLTTHLYGVTIREKRKESGFSIRAFAKKLGISAAFLSGVEAGDYPRFSIEVEQNFYNSIIGEKPNLYLAYLIDAKNKRLMELEGIESKIQKLSSVK